MTTDAETNADPALDLLTKYVGKIKLILGLRDWRIVVEIDHPARGGEAEIVVADCRMDARLIVSPELADEMEHAHDDLSRERSRHVIVHELIHCHLHPIRVHAQTIRHTLGTAAFAPFAEGHDTAVERSVDAITSAICPLIPLP